MAKILVLRGVPDEELVMLKGHTVFYPGLGKAFSKEEIFSYLPDVEAILASGKVDKEMIESAPKLKVISNFGAGYDQIDVQAATQRGIPVTNTPNITALPTAEIAIGLILSVARNLCVLNENIRENPQNQFGLSKFTGFSLGGKTLGIIGMGRIGGIVAQFGKLMGMKVLYHNRNKLKNEDAFDCEYTSLDELLKESDVVSIHTPLTLQSKNLLSKEKMALMKESSIVINTARGGVMDYDALIEMLEEGKLAGAGLDVFPNEPNVPEKLLPMKQVVLAPHVGTNTLDSRNKMTKAACENILKIFSEEKPENTVNPIVYE